MLPIDAGWKISDEWPVCCSLNFFLFFLTVLTKFLHGNTVVLAWLPLYSMWEVWLLGALAAVIGQIRPVPAPLLAQACVDAGLCHLRGKVD